MTANLPAACARLLPTFEDLAERSTDMSEEEAAAVPAVAKGLLRASRTRSYGSLVRSPLSPVRQRRIEHKLQPGETLQGLALKYGVSVSNYSL